MRLFSGDKALIFKIVNAIIFIWLIAACVIFFNSVVDLFFVEAPLTEKQYEVTYCQNYKNLEDNPDMEYNCADDFVSYEIREERSSSQDNKFAIFSGGQVLIVGFVLYFLNKEKPKKKKNN